MVSYLVVIFFTFAGGLVCLEMEFSENLQEQFEEWVTREVISRGDFLHGAGRNFRRSTFFDYSTVMPEWIPPGHQTGE